MYIEVQFDIMNILSYQSGLSEWHHVRVVQILGGISMKTCEQLEHFGVVPLPPSCKVRLF